MGHNEKSIHYNHNIPEKNSKTSEAKNEKCKGYTLLSIT